MEKRPLIQIVYTSLVSSDRVDAGEFFAMVQGASRKFASMGITGRLIFADGRFFQALEGPPLNLDPWIRDVERDPRHHSMAIVLRRSIEKRQFEGWRMRRLGFCDGAQAIAEFEAILARRHDAGSIMSILENRLSRERVLSG